MSDRDAPRCCHASPFKLGRGVTVYWSPSERTHLVVWTTPDGRRRKKRFRAHAEAMDGAHQASTQLGEAANQPVDQATATAAAAEDASVPQFVERWIDDHQGPREWTLDYIDKLQGLKRNWVMVYLDLPLESWTVADSVALFTVMERQGISPSQRRSVLSVLRQTGRYAVHLGLLDRDPCVGISIRNVRSARRVTPVATTNGVTDYREVGEAPSTRDVERLAKSLAAAGDDPLLALLPAYSGFRWGEVFALEREDFDFENNTVHVVRRVDRKGHARHGDILPAGGGPPLYWRTRYGFAALPKARRVHVTLLPEHLCALVAARPPGLLLPNTRGRYRTNASHFNDSSFAVAREEAGWPRGPDGKWIWTVHSLRHHAASWMLSELRLPMTEVASVLGHANAAVTMRIYAHADSDAAARAADVTRGWQPPAV